MPITADGLTFDSEDEKLRFECKLEIEQLWMSGQDPKAVHRLARTHPELARELYDFFAFMIDVHAGPSPWRRAGSEPPAVPTTKRPVSFLALLRQTTLSVDEIAESMELTPAFLVDVSDNGRVVPLGARQELVRRAAVLRPLDDTEGIGSFDIRSFRRAASRDGPYPVSHLTYEELVNRSRLSAEQKRFWLGLG